MSKLKEIKDFIKNDLSDGDLYVAVYIGQQEFTTLELTEEEKTELRALVLTWGERRSRAYISDDIAGMYVPEKFRGQMEQLLKEIKEYES